MSSSSSRSKVTITLGRTGQVVKTGASTEMINSGGKRPMRERLGEGFEDPSFSGGLINSKRQRIGSSGTDFGGGILDQQIGGGDLRLKLIQKGVNKKPPTFNGEVDLREKLLRKLPKKPASNHPSNHLMERQRVMQRERERESEKQIERHREREIDPSARRVVATRSVDNLPPYASWTYDRRDELHPSRSSRGAMSPPPPPPPLSRPYLDLGPVGSPAAVSSRPCSSGYGLKRGRDLVGGSRVAPDYVTNGVSMEARKSILPPPPPQKQLPDLPDDVDDLLDYLDLKKYKITFKIEEVDMATLKQMEESDLKELGIPMGPRKKILLAVRPSAKQRPH